MARLRAIGSSCRLALAGCATAPAKSPSDCSCARQRGADRPRLPPAPQPNAAPAKPRGQPRAAGAAQPLLRRRRPMVHADSADALDAPGASSTVADARRRGLADRRRTPSPA